MQDSLTYEKKKLDLKKYIEKLEKECKKYFGPLNKYVYPKSNPYTNYADVDEFKKKAMQGKSEKDYINNKTCRFIADIETDKDDKRRYYTKVQNKRECDFVNGKWDETSINRKNKIDTGVCWVTHEDKTCGQSIQSTDILRSFKSKYNKNMPSIINEESMRCNKIPGCTLEQQTYYTYDCVSKPIDSIKEDTMVSTPPEDMPLDKFETFLEDWYLKKKYGAYPKTGELLGRGDRCNGLSEEEIEEDESSTAPPPLEMPEYISFRNLNPTSTKDAIIIKKFMSIENFKYFKEDWQKRLKLGPEKYKEYVQKNGYDTLEPFYNRMEKLQMEADYRIKIKSVASPKPSKMLPSLPQSVVNMVMKNIALKKSNTRGLLAWHSTGSGKCHALNTPILMYDGSIKMVQDIKVGECLMGDDSTPRKVLSLATGKDDMYDIFFNYGKYCVNSEHILCLKDVNDNVVEIPVCDYLKLDKSEQESLRGYTVGVSFPSIPTKKSPYAIGLMVGAAKIDKIPDEYKINDRNIRLNVIMGLLDTVDQTDIGDNNIELSITGTLAEDVIYILRSLGICVYKTLNDTVNICLKKSEAISVSYVNHDTYYGFTLDGNNRYLLGDFTVTHNTCTATGVFDAFWDRTDKDIIFASSIDAIASNPDFVFHKCAYNMFPRFQTDIFKGNSEAQSLALIAAAFKQRGVRYLSFAKLSNRVAKYKKDNNSADSINLNNAILVIDEVHNLFRPLANQKKQHEFLEAELIDPKKYPNLQIVILTATPGDNVPDVLKLLNIVRNVDSPIIKPMDITSKQSIDQFKEQIRGLVSYFDMSYDDTKFPKVIDSEPVKLPMSQFQYKKYIEAYKTVKEAQKNYKALVKKNDLGKYWEPARKYSNMLFNFAQDMDLNDFSSKIPHVIDMFEKYPDEKHYLYSAFYARGGYGGHGVVAIAKELEKKGYKQLTVAEAKKYNKTGKLPEAGIKRYILVINTELGDGPNAGKNLHELLKIYNHPDNKEGKLIHIMLASNKYNESMTLFSVSRIHMFESMLTMAAEKQTIGRAVRFCSFAQKNRSKGEWKVYIHRYMSDKPEPIVIDNGPIRQKLQSEVAIIESELDVIKETKKAITKMTKLIEKGKGDQKELDKLVKDVNESNLEELKIRLKEKNKELKKLDAPVKFSDANIENIEEKIFKESQERFKELFTIYNSMKEAAIDCRLLKQFHETTANQKIDCV